MKKKNLFLIALLLLVSAFCLTACQAGEAGDIGETGDKGPTGIAGTNGTNGTNGTDGQNGENGEDGEDAKAPTFRVTDAGIEYQYEGDTEWTVLISMDDLIGHSERYTVSFDANGGTAIASLTELYYKQVPTLPKAVRAGYTFVGWQNPAKEAGVVYTDGEFAVLADTTLKAVWGSTVVIDNGNVDLAALTAGASFKITGYKAAATGATLNIGTPTTLSCGMYWDRLLLKTLDSTKGIYEIVDFAVSGKSLPSTTFDYVIGVHSGCTDADSKDALIAMVKAENVGQIISLTGFDPASTETVADITAKLYTGYTKPAPILEGATYTFPTRTAVDGKAFLGWTSDKKTIVTDATVVPTGDISYNSVYAYTLTYELNGGALPTGATTPETVDTAEKAAAALPIATCEGKLFKGWFSDAEFTNAVTVKPITDTKLYAKFVVATTVTYTLDGGTPYYANREEMVDDFLTDAMEKYEKTSKPNCMVITNTSPEGSVGFANVFTTAIYGMFTDEAYAAKWSWMKEYILEKSASVSTLSYLQSNNETAWRYAVGAFLFKDHRTTWIASADFTTEAMYNGFWTCSYFTATTIVEEYYGEANAIKVYKEGYTFDGWFDAEGTKYETFEEVLTAKAIAVTAKWTAVVPETPAA